MLDFCFYKSMESLSRNQDIANSFVNHPSYINTVGYIKDMGAFAIYDQSKGYFVIQDPNDFDALIYRFVVSCSKKSVSMSAVYDVREQIKVLAKRQFTSAQSEYIALTDCLLSTLTFKTAPFDIRHEVFFGLPFSSHELVKDNFDQSRFKSFLNEVLVKNDKTPDTELQTIIQEMFGYCLLPTVSAEASFFMVGEGSNGKSVLLYLLENIIGIKLCSALSVEHMTTSQHATTSLVGKRLNICYEEESQFVKSDKFKALVSGEPTEINYKYGKIFSVRLPVKFIFATNELPTFSGFNHGLLRRIKIIPFKRRFADNEQDRTLKPKLLSELPIITAWAIKGAKRLVQNGYKFSDSKASNEVKEEFESNLSAAVAFIREEYKEDENSFMFYSDLYTRFVEWCKENGKKQMSKTTFLRDINRVLTIPSSAQYNHDLRRTDRGRSLAKIVDSYTENKDINPELPNYGSE